MFQQRTYYDACYSFFHCPFVEHERFFDNFEIYPYKFKFCGLKDDYMNQFAEIYNHKMNRKNSIKVVSDGKRTELVR